MEIRGRQAFNQARTILENAGFAKEAARWEGQVLLCHFWGKTTMECLLSLEEILPESVVRAYEEAIEKRIHGTPLQHLTGSQDFYKASFHVKPGVLIPREDTAILVEEALEVLPLETPCRVLDLGLGSGIILISLALERSLLTGFGVDLNPQALALARENMEQLGVANRLELFPGSWYEALPKETSLFDLIVSNPPYITTEEMADLPPEVLADPHLALWGGEDGLEAYRHLIPQGIPWLKPGGWLMVEIGWLQGPAVKALFEAAGYDTVEIVQDHGQRDRVVRGRWGKET